MFENTSSCLSDYSLRDKVISFITSKTGKQEISTDINNGNILFETRLSDFFSKFPQTTIWKPYSNDRTHNIIYRKIGIVKNTNMTCAVHIGRRFLCIYSTYSCISRLCILRTLTFFLLKFDIFRIIYLCIVPPVTENAWFFNYSKISMNNANSYIYIKTW